MAVTASETPGSESPDGESPVQGRLRRRRNILIGVVILALMASVGGLLVSTSIKSPAQLAAQTSSPVMPQSLSVSQWTYIADRGVHTFR